MRPTGIRILDRSSPHNYPQPGSFLSWVTLASPAHNKSVASRPIAASPLSEPDKSKDFWRFSPDASAARLAYIGPAGSRWQAGGLGIVPNLPLIDPCVGAGATGSVSITVRVVDEAG